MAGTAGGGAGGGGGSAGHWLSGISPAAAANAASALATAGLLIVGPCCALLTGRWALTAAASCFAFALGVVFGVPDQIFVTITQYAFLAAVAAVGLTATISAAILQRQRP